MGTGRQNSRPGVVVLDANSASSTGAIRSLGRQEIHTVVAAEHRSPPGFASRYCDESVTTPDPRIDLDAYETAILDLAERPDVDTVLPFRETDAYVLSHNRRTLADHVGTPWPSFDTLRSVQDRVQLFEVAQDAGIPTPATGLLDDWDDWTRGVVVKPRYTVNVPEYGFDEYQPRESSNVYVASDDVDRSDIVAEMGHVPIVQEYVPTPDEYGFFALYDHGDPVATFQHRQRRGWKYCGGPSAYRESVDIPELEATGRRLLDELDWHGVAMVEFLRDPDTGEFKLMEVNPRFWSSLPFTIQAGVDFPYLYWRQATGRPIETPPDYDVGVAGHLLWGEVLHLASILRDDYPLVDRPSFLRTLAAVTASLLHSPRFDYLDPRDPGPFVRDLRNRLPLGRDTVQRSIVRPPDDENDTQRADLDVDS